MAARSATPNVLVTGASGFLGRHCLNELIRRGFRVHAVSRRANIQAPADVTWHEVDLLREGAASSLVAALRPTNLLHLAWVTTPAIYRSAPENLDWLRASLALLRAFGEAGGRRFVGIGSSSEYQADNSPCREDETPIRPVTIYGQSKSAFATATQACARLYGFSAAWARIFLPYGTGDSLDRLIPSLISALSAGKTIEVTEGRQIRDFIYAPDVAGLIAQLVARDDAIGAYNVGTGRGVAVRLVIEWVADRLNARGLVLFGGRAGRDDEPFSLVADMSKARRVLDCQQPTSIESGLEQVIANCRQAFLA